LGFYLHLFPSADIEDMSKSKQLPVELIGLFSKDVRIIAQSMSHDFVKISVAFGLNCLVELFIVFHIYLFQFFGHETNSDMRQKEALSDEIWGTHLLLGRGIPHEAGFFHALDGQSHSRVVGIGPLALEVLLHIEVQVIQLFKVCRLGNIVIGH
jgi:hypothetical protein